MYVRLPEGMDVDKTKLVIVDNMELCWSSNIFHDDWICKKLSLVCDNTKNLW